MKNPITTLKGFQEAVQESFDDLEKPMELFLKVQKDPVRWRDQYFYNNGIKAVMWSCRVMAQTAEAKLAIALKALESLQEFEVAETALKDIAKVSSDDFR